MAITADQIAEITRSTVDLYRAAERAILEAVTRRLAAGMDTPDWAATRLGALSTLRRTIEGVLALVENEAAGSIRETLAKAYRTGQVAATADLPARLLPRDPDAVRPRGIVAEQVPRAGVIESLAAALVADVGERRSNVLRHVLDVYRTVVQQASAVSVAGGMTRRQASQIAYQRFVDQGVSSFIDSRGRVWRLSSYVEMAVRTVTQRAAVQGQTDRLTTLGVDTVIVSDSPRECPKCRPWEGKILSISGAHRGRVDLPSIAGSGTVTVEIAGSVEQARAAGLQHPNCTHALRAYLPGATRRPARPTANPNGYEAKERQREIERRIRKWKERELAAVDPAAKAAAKGKVRAWQRTMQDHLAANPELKRLPYREQIGAGNLPVRTGQRQTPTGAPPTAAPAPPLPRRTRTATPSRPETLADMLDMDLETAAARDVAKEAFAEVVNGEYAGLTVDLNGVERYVGFGEDGEAAGILARMSIYPDNLSGDKIGTCQRAFYRDEQGDLVAVHAYLQLDRAVRGKGFASEFNANLERWYRQQGVTRIEIHANIDIGGYAWASHGYDFADEESAESVVELLRHTVEAYQERAELLREQAADATSHAAAAELRHRAEQLEEQVEQAGDITDRATVAAFGADDFPTPWKICQLGRTDGAEQWLGKDAMLGSDWQGVKWL